MFTDASFFHRLWDRGVDIAANTISGGILAVIAGAGYLAKLRLDLWNDKSKEEQKIRIHREEASRRARADHKARTQGLKRDLHNMAATIAKERNPHRLEEMWDDYRAWLKNNGLELLPTNIDILSQFSGVGSGRGATPDPDLGPHLSTAITRTELPNPSLIHNAIAGHGPREGGRRT